MHVRRNLFGAIGLLHRGYWQEVNGRDMRRANFGRDGDGVQLVAVRHRVPVVMVAARNDVRSGHIGGMIHRRTVNVMIGVFGGMVGIGCVFGLGCVFSRMVPIGAVLQRHMNLRPEA